MKILFLGLHALFTPGKEHNGATQKHLIVYTYIVYTYSMILSVKPYSIALSFLEKMDR
jgi:hypothetical protein